MNVLFQEKIYGFLEPTGIRFTINVSGHTVWVTAYLLPSRVFHTAPLFLLSTDLPENDYLAQTISHKLYDANPETRIAASILLGIGGARLLEELRWEPQIYHMNESHGLPLAFYLNKRYNSQDEVRKRLVYTNHTPEPAGNQRSDLSTLFRMGFFSGLSQTEVKQVIPTTDSVLDHTLCALRMAGRANAVSRMHLNTLKKVWGDFTDICPLQAITNAQNFTYWADEKMYQVLKEQDDQKLLQRKKSCKQLLFEEVSDQCGEIYEPAVFTLVFAKRFAGYKRADLLLRDQQRFHRLVTNRDLPIQIIWAGKPYPMDYAGIATFDKVVYTAKTYPNCSVLVGYELKLSRLLKGGADVWLNVPRLTHEASGTSGMTAAMNGALNLSTMDGWFPEFAKPGINCFALPPADLSLTDSEQDDWDATHLYNVLEQTILPLFYQDPGRWLTMVKQSMQDIIPQFDSKRMADEYYHQMYQPTGAEKSLSFIKEMTREKSS
jgi:starch phosphorylase